MHHSFVKSYSVSASLISPSTVKREMLSRSGQFSVKIITCVTRNLNATLLFTFHSFWLRRQSKSALNLQAFILG